MPEYSLTFEIPAEFTIKIEAPEGISKEELIKLVTTDMLYEGTIDYNTDVVREEWDIASTQPEMVTAFDEDFEFIE